MLKVTVQCAMLSVSSGIIGCTGHDTMTTNRGGKVLMEKTLGRNAETKK
jgi:hypothetical protein